MHNEAGHRGRDATYRHLSDRYHWPNMYDDVSFFVRSCKSCQYYSKAQPRIQVTITSSPSILRCFIMDTVHMPKAKGGFKYLLHASDDTSKWVEARASKVNMAEAWVKFLYQDVICRFGCLLWVTCDGGPEFRGELRKMFARYGIPVVVSSPYYPEGNGIAERDGQTLKNALIRTCGKRTGRWASYLPSALWAIRTTTSRVTGYTPYFLLYGKHCLFPYNITDRTWYALE